MKSLQKRLKKKEAQNEVAKAVKYAKQGKDVRLWSMISAMEESINGKMNIDTLYDMVNWNQIKRMTLQEIRNQPMWRILSSNLIKLSQGRG